MTIRYDAPCLICGENQWKPIYTGLIRTGKFGQLSENDHTVWECGACLAGFLPDVKMNYETSEYREMFDGASTAEEYFKHHDGEQGANLAEMAKLSDFEGLTLADIGCGAGSFLNRMLDKVGPTIAIEPYQSYHSILRENGHKVYSYPADALKDYEGKVDLAVSFAVIEHILNPFEFMQTIRKLLKPGGRLLLSTPNRDDWLISFLPGIYDCFFYRQAHNWYFNGLSLEKLGSLSGFSEIAIGYRHRFDLSNALLWIRDKRPTGLGKMPILESLDANFQDTLTSQGISDYIYAWFAL